MYKTIVYAIVFLFLAGCSTNVTRQSTDLKQTFVYSDQVHISYEVHGNGNSSIVFLHGFGASVETWRDVQSQLGEGNKLFFLDLKGFGLSSKPDDDKYSIEDQADIVLAFVKARNLHDVTLVGHSYGGAVSLFTYLRDRSNPGKEVIRRLILIDAAAYVQNFPFFIDVLRNPFLGWVVMNLMPAQVRASITLNYLFHDPNKLSEELVSRYAEFFDQPGCYHSFVECAERIVPANPDSITALIRTIGVPTLVLWGADDPAISVEHARRLHKDIRNSSMVIIPDCGHNPHEEAPKESIQAIRDFLKR